jgi:Ca2+-binding EF-hand superfamily protein
MAKLTRKKSVVHGLALGDEERVSAFRDLFHMCDKNGDGEVSLDELADVFREMKMTATKEEIQELFEVFLPSFSFA